MQVYGDTDSSKKWKALLPLQSLKKNSILKLVKKKNLSDRKD